MKKSLVIAAMFLSLFNISCSDFLDTKPFDKITGEQTWKSKELTASFIYQIYPDIIDSDAWLGAYAHSNTCRSESSTKNAMAGTLWGAYWTKDRAENMTKQDNYGWLNYGVLWRIHTAMEEIPKSTALPDDFKKRTIAELHFLRAAHYFVYARQYGGLQLIDRKLAPEDNLQIPRSTPKETYDFIISDLEKAANELPESTERGRASSVAANALITRVALLAASYVDGGAANSAYYDRAIQAGVAMGINGDGSQLSPYSDMFRAYETAIASKELILVRERLKVNTSLYDTPMQYQGLSTGHYSAYAKEHFPINVTMGYWGMDGGAWPTQDLVDDYLVTDVDGSIKYWEDASYTTTGANVDEQMYFSRDKKRDQRFYSTILYDSCLYFNSQARIFFRRDGNSSNANSRINEGSEQEYGYKAGDQDNWNSSTGYCMIKYHYDHVVSLSDPGAQKLDYCFSVLRFGEIYLNMAEAYLMKGDYVNAKRYIAATMVKHGGFAADQVEAYLTAKTGNNWGDGLFEAYKRERNVEMIYENNDYYWSLLRWGMRTSGGLKSGEYATNGYVIPELQGSLRIIRISRDGKSYEIVEDNNVVGEARFTPRRYLLPINETFRLQSGVTQNLGWE